MLCDVHESLVSLCTLYSYSYTSTYMYEKTILQLPGLRRQTYIHVHEMYVHIHVQCTMYVNRAEGRAAWPAYIVGACLAYMYIEL